MASNKRKSKGLAGLSVKQSIFVQEYVKDFNARRAAEMSGYDPDYGYNLLEKQSIKTALEFCVTDAFNNMAIDAEWVLWELADNHRIARQHGNISASNTALKTLMQHVSIDAMAKQKMEMDLLGDKEMMERLRRGRMVAAGLTEPVQDDAVEKFFNESEDNDDEPQDDVPSFL